MESKFENTIPEYKTEGEYKKAKERLVIAEKAILARGGFMEPSIKHWVVEFERIATACLQYEIKNNLLPI